MKLVGIFRVVNIENTKFEGIVRIRMKSEDNVEVAVEYPLNVLGVAISQDNIINLSIDNEKDLNYKNNWDVYMNGMVYYVNNGVIKISIGGLIMDVNNYKGDARVGEKVYIGIKISK